MKIGEVKSIKDLQEVARLNKRLYYFIFLIGVILVILAGLWLQQSNIIGNIISQRNQPDQYKDFLKLLDNEVPRVIVVVDPVKILQDNPEGADFYKSAKKDDVVFVFEKLKLAIIYRPTTKEIVNVSTVSLN
jgi:hypothetical protein